MKKSPGAWVVIAGGGTAGHVVPGLAIAAEFESRGVPPSLIHYVGSKRGIETRLVPAAGFPLTVLPGRGIQRRFTLTNIASVFGLMRAVVEAVVLVGRTRPAVVVGLGGYASVPCVIAAVLWRIPIVVAEQNAVPGAANRLAGRFAKASAVSFPDTDLPRAVWTGNPVRPEVLAVDRIDGRSRARETMEIGPEQTLLVVFGGSLGARRINESLFEALPGWRHRSDLAVRHVAGRRDHADLAVRVPVSAEDTLRFELVEYEDDMPMVYAAADIVLCRSGASSVAELAVVGLPAVLVPLPGAPGDHQTANAMALVDAGAAVHVVDAELDGDRLAEEIDRLLSNPETLGEMGAAAHTVARRGAAGAVADLVERHASRPVPTGAPDDS